MLYCLSDTHLSFTTDKPMNVFGRTWERHEERIRENWIKAVKDEDTVVIAGDVSWGMTFEEAQELDTTERGEGGFGSTGK